MRAVVLSGGPATSHDFPATTACLTGLLAEAGMRAEVHERVDDACAALPGAGLYVVNALRATMRSPGTPQRFREQAEREGVSPSPSSRLRFDEHLAAGGGVLAIHTAALCFDDWPQ